MVEEKITKKDLRKELLKISEGLLSSLTDVVLVFFNYGYELLYDPQIARSLPYAFSRMDSRMAKVNYLTLKRAVKNALEKGWIKEDLRLTEKGVERMGRIFPEYKPSATWDGKWYFVNFDIPEKLHRKRDILREDLKILGFGKLQESVWISPFNFLGEIEKIIKAHFLTPYVIFSISDKVGQNKAKILAEKIWGPSKINIDYREFIDVLQRKQGPSISEAIFKYHRILREDPQLPKELLPEDWLGSEANRLYLAYLKSAKKQK